MQTSRDIQAQREQLNPTEAVRAFQEDTHYIAPTPNEVNTIQAAHNRTLEALQRDHSTRLDLIRRHVNELQQVDIDGFNLEGAKRLVRNYEDEVSGIKRRHAAHLYGFPEESTSAEREAAVQLYKHINARRTFRAFLEKARARIASHDEFPGKKELTDFLEGRGNFPFGFRFPKEPHNRGLDTDLLAQFPYLTDEGVIHTNQGYARVETILTHEEMREMARS